MRSNPIALASSSVSSYASFTVEKAPQVILSFGKYVAKGGKPTLNWFGFGLDLAGSGNPENQP